MSYGGAGSTLLSELGRLAGRTLIALAGLTAVLIGLGYKAALVPFQFWAPDAYDGAPVSVAAYLSVITKVAAIFAFAQILRDLPVGNSWPLVVALIAAMTMTCGYLAALVQSNEVRLLAYSSMAQAGYFMMGIVDLGPGLLALSVTVSMTIFRVWRTGPTRRTFWTNSPRPE
ncbi:proton-conducting transporter membrane subunit (plasmid) [Paracoccus sediminicola]|nr:proton-conducting transporter membrane subunit [Paracoccus sediminicola]WBU58715.1 proton-conducting transporter membrane subunit [Paracoccus sediminicola]